MDVDDRLPVFREHIVEHLVAQDAGGVEHDVQPAKGVAGLLDHRETVVEFGNRTVIRRRLAARRFDLVDDLLRRRLVGPFAAAASAWIVDHDLCAVRRHQLGDLGSDAPTRAGANRNPSFEHAHPSTPSGSCLVSRVVGGYAGFVNPRRPRLRRATQTEVQK